MLINPAEPAETIKQKRGKNEVQLGQYSDMVGLCRRLAMMMLGKAIPLHLEPGGWRPLNGKFSEEIE